MYLPLTIYLKFWTCKYITDRKFNQPIVLELKVSWSIPVLVLCGGLIIFLISPSTVVEPSYFILFLLFSVICGNCPFFSLSDLALLKFKSASKLQNVQLGRFVLHLWSSRAFFFCTYAIWVFCHLVSKVEQRERKREGCADLFTTKGSKRRRQAKVKRPQKSTPLHCTVCVFEWPLVGFQFDFSPVFAQGHGLYKRHPEKDLLKRSSRHSLCLSISCEHGGQRRSEHRLPCQTKVRLASS